jgi:hypothetical protein
LGGNDAGMPMRLVVSKFGKGFNNFCLQW